MKSAPFRLVTPDSLEEALEVLDEHGDEAKVLAGGQSLVPIMNFRMAQPEVLVDLGRLADLRGIDLADDGTLRIGSTTRQRALELHTTVAKNWHLVADAIPMIGHVGIRNRGTVGGSLAHADPAAELPSVCVALDASLVARGPQGRRVIPASDFFQMIFTTDLAVNEVLTEVIIPPPSPGTGSAWLEFARRHGDFALIGVAAVVTLGEDGSCTDARLVLAGAENTPVRVDGGGVVKGRQPVPTLWDELATHAADSCEPPSDSHASARYRRRLVRVLGRRALDLAARRATRGAMDDR
jgi:CO/xanthine dehydrogenase FAD-binding subunit